jgi:hypothetical protein
MASPTQLGIFQMNGYNDNDYRNFKPSPWEFIIGISAGWITAAAFFYCVAKFV